MNDIILDILLLLLKPIIGSAKELVQEIRIIRKNLHFYARQIASPGLMEKEEIENAVNSLRKNATNLSELEFSVKCFSFLTFMHIVPSKTNINKASKLLIRLSNSLGYIPFNNCNLNNGMKNSENADKIKSLLLIKPDLCERFSSWLVFLLTGIGGYEVVKYIANIIKKLLEFL